MADIIIRKINEVYLQIECVKQIAGELREHFSYYAANYQHDPRVKNRVWDGKFYLFNYRDQTIYKGLYNAIVEFAQTRSYSIQTEYQWVDNGITKDDVLKLYNRFDPIHEIWESQLDSIHYALAHKNVLIKSPTSSGKSLISYNLALILKGLGPVIIIVPTVNLVEQLYKDFHDYSTKNGIDVDAMVHRIYAGQDKETDKPVTISTWQSIYEQPPEYFHRFHTVIGDECHRFKAKSLKTILEATQNAVYRIGMTGSLDGKEVNEMILTGLFGPILQVTTSYEMIQDGKATPMTVKLRLMEYDDVKAPKPKPKETIYAKQKEWLLANEKRNRYIVDCLEEGEGNKLVLFNLIEHGKELYKLIKSKYGEDRVFYIDGKVSIAKRELIRSTLDGMNNAILVATYGTYSEGMNVPSIHHVYSTLPERSQVRILQSIGRVLRLRKGKTESTMWDFADKFHWNGRLNMGYGQYESRVKLYLEQKYPIEYKEIRI